MVSSWAYAHITLTKSNLSYSSMHLLLPTPKVFQQFIRLVKYSGGISGLLGTTFLDMERMSLRSIRYLGGGPIDRYLIILQYMSVYANILN